MKKLFNLGVSDPLTLGMAHPIADRLETLGRARPATWRSRTLALSAMSVLAIASAPLTIASETAEETNKEIKLKVISNVTGETPQSYEIITENGETRAYRILKGGDREPAKLEKAEDGSSRLIYSDGQIIDLPNINLKNLEGLEALAGLKSLEGLESLERLKSLEGLTVSLEGLEALEGLSELEGFDFTGSDFGFSDRNRRVKIIRKDDGNFSVPDSIVSADDFDFAVDLNVVLDSNEKSLASVKRQLDRTKLQLESLAGDENVAFDLENALRDLENAQKSLEAAENRLLDVTE